MQGFIRLVARVGSGDPVRSYVCTQRLHWMKFVVFIAETYVQLVITDLRAILLARLDRLR